MIGAEAAPRSLELGDYLRVLRRRWLVILLAAVAFTGAAAVYERERPVVYEATASVLVRPVSVDPGRSPVRPDQLVSAPTEREVLRSTSIVEGALARADVGLDATAVQENLSVSAIEGTQVLRVTYLDRDPARAETITHAVASHYLAQRRSSAARQVEESSEELDGELADAWQALEEVDEVLAGTEEDSPERMQAAARQGYLLNLVQQLQSELTALSQLSVDPGEIISPATVASQPTGMSTAMIILVGLGCGLLIGAPLAFVVDRSDDRVREAGEVEASLGLPVLATVPRLGRGRQSLLLSRHGNVAVESFRRLRNNMLTLAGHRQWSSIMVTSPLPREGKTMVAANLAVSTARTGVDVTLVSADLHLPTLHRLFDLPLGPGLSDVLEGGKALDDVQWTVPGLENLKVVTAGRSSQAPGDLLTSAGMTEFLAEAGQREGLVILDAPPVLAVSECLALSRCVDAVLMVVRAGRTRLQHLETARRSLERVRVSLAGAVLVGKVTRSQLRAYRAYRGSDVREDVDLLTRSARDESNARLRGRARRSVVSGALHRQQGRDPS